MTRRSPFRHFKTSPEVIRLAVMLYIRFPLSLRNVEDLLHERGIEVSHETVRVWWQRFGPMFAAEIRRKRVGGLRSSRWRWNLDEVFVRINGVQHDLRRAVDLEGEVLEAFVSKHRDRRAALTFLRKLMKRHDRPNELVTDKLRSYGAALKELGAAGLQTTDRWENNRAETSHQPFRQRERAMLIMTRDIYTKAGHLACHAASSTCAGTSGRPCGRGAWRRTPRAPHPRGPPHARGSAGHR